MPKNVIAADVQMLGTVLYCEVSDKDNPRPLLPKGHRNTVINLLHHGDHPNAKESIRRVAQDYYWPGLRKDIEGFVKTCHPCQVAKQAKTVNPGVGKFEVPDTRFSVIHLDIVGPLPRSHDGYKYLLSCFDRTSRWFEAYPLQQASAAEVATAFLQWISRFGICDRAVSDNGNAFVSRLFQDVMKNFGVEVTFTPAYHAATNGAIERQHQTMKNALKAALVDMGNDHRDQWTKALPWVLLGKRVQYQPFLDSSSAQLVLGKSPKLPGQLLGEPGPPLNTVETRALLDQLYRLHDRPGIKTSTKTSELDISSTEKATHVYLRVDKPESLCPKFEGPYAINSRPSRSTIEVILGKKKNGDLRLQTYHWSFAKVAHMRDDASAAHRPQLGRHKKDSGESLSSNTGQNNKKSLPQTSEQISNKNSSVDLRMSFRGGGAGATDFPQQSFVDSESERVRPITSPSVHRQQPIRTRPAEPAEIQTTLGERVSTRPIRASRNPNPVYATN